MNEIQKQYLNRFLSSLPKEEREQYDSYSADYFCADKENANICVELILRREKTATCSLKYWYESGLEPMPRVKHLQVVTDWDGNPTSIIETINISECRFSDVSSEFAAAEGEGDQSLAWWRTAHWDFFSKECEDQGLTPNENMVLVLETFKVVYV